MKPGRSWSAAPARPAAGGAGRRVLTRRDLRPGRVRRPAGVRFPIRGIAREVHTRGRACLRTLRPIRARTAGPALCARRRHGIPGAAGSRASQEGQRRRRTCRNVSWRLGMLTRRAIPQARRGAQRPSRSRRVRRPGRRRRPAAAATGRRLRRGRGQDRLHLERRGRGCFARMSAAYPATCGAANELPVATIRPPSRQATSTSTPWAPNSTGGSGL